MARLQSSQTNNELQTHLFALLAQTPSLSLATPIQECLKELFKSHPSLRTELDNGVLHLLHNQIPQALSIFSSLVKKDPLYAEAWNKKATCHYLLGDSESPKDFIGEE